jgi:hypothetical protein
MTEEQAEDAVHGADRDRRFAAIAQMAVPLLEALVSRIGNHDPDPQALVAGTVGCSVCAGLLQDLRASLEAIENHLETSPDEPGHDPWVQATDQALLGLRHGVSELSSALRQQTYIAKAYAATATTTPVTPAPDPTPTPLAAGVVTGFSTQGTASYTPPSATGTVPASVDLAPPQAS